MNIHIRRALYLASALVVASQAQAQESYYSRSLSFGDSLSDTGRILRETGYDAPAVFGPILGGPGIYGDGLWSNAPNFMQVLPGELGLEYLPNNHYAVGGATSGSQAASVTSPFSPFGFTDQVDQFLARDGVLRSRDLVNVWFGYNDIRTIIQTGGDIQAGIDTVHANITRNIGRLAEVGGENFVVFNTQTWRRDTGQPGADSPISAQFNAGLVAALQPLSDSGFNIHFFDLAELSARFRANPTAYGFAANAGTVDCSDDPVCAASGSTTGDADHFISPEGIHFSGRANGWIAAYVANQLSAPLTIGPQGEIGQSAGLAFSSSLLDYLGSSRGPAVLPVPSGTSANEDTSGSTAYDRDSPFSFFAFGTYLNVERTAFSAAGGGSTGSSFDADLGGITAGVSYQAAPELAVGAALNYLSTRVGLDGLSQGSIDMDSVQGALFASLALPDMFADAALTYGVNDYELERPGVMADRLTASPSGNTFTATGRVGYLFDFGNFTAGPIAELAYAHASVDPYEESGDTLLTIGARRQELESLTAGTGVQIKAASARSGGMATAFLNVTVHHDFLDSARTITSYQTYAPTLPFRTQAGRDGDDVYGRVAGGVNVDLGTGFSASLTGSTSFARSGGNDHTISASLKLRF
jgi:phospholipase/lecithinase/hemolysin/uncharacterized protein YhjY with autotransporter beta-barrel domain